MAKVTIVTHQQIPDGVADDLALAQALARITVPYRFAVWDDPEVDWALTGITIVRSAWDYHHSPERWSNWIASVSEQTRLINAPALLRWNSDKGYLLDLANRQVPIVPTRVVDDAAALVEVCARKHWSDVVLKPLIGASSLDVRRFQNLPADQAALEHAALLGARGPFIVQPFQRSIISAAERSLVFLSGRFSHAFRKPAFHAELGNAKLRAHKPTDAELLTAEGALRAMPDRAVYARVDLLTSVNGPLVMELEVIEPELAFHLGPGSADALAATLAAMVKRQTGE